MGKTKEKTKELYLKYPERDLWDGPVYAVRRETLRKEADLTVKYYV